MPTASEGAPPVRLKRVSSPTRAARSAICAVVTGKPQPEMVATALGGMRSHDSRRTVHGEVRAGFQDCRRHHGHDGYERFHQHTSIPYQSGMAFLAEQLGSGAG